MHARKNARKLGKKINQTIKKINKLNLMILV